MSHGLADSFGTRHGEVVDELVLSHEPGVEVLTTSAYPSPDLHCISDFELSSHQQSDFFSIPRER